jgi:uncharacterized protein YaiI (UPF0178 family)
MRLIIDGDSFPFINEAVKIAVSRNTEYIIFANKQRRPIKKYEHAWITVPNFYGSADLAILESLRDDDVVVTDDRALAAECADKGATVMRSHGGDFNKKQSPKEYARLRKMSAAERDGVLAVKRRLLTLRLESALDGSGDDAAAERERRALFSKLNSLSAARLLPGARAKPRSLPPARSFGGSSARDKRFVRARRRRKKAFRRRSAGVFYIRGKRHYGAGKRGAAERRRLRERAAHELDAAEAQKLLAALELSRVKIRRKAREAAERQNREAAEIARLQAKENTELTQAELERIDAFYNERTAALEHEEPAVESSAERVKLAREIERLAAKKISLLVEDKLAAEKAAKREAERLRKLSAKAREAETAARQEAERFKHSSAGKHTAAESCYRAAAKLESRAKAKLEAIAAPEREITENGELYLLTRALDDKRFEAIKASIRESRRAAEELKARAAEQRVSADYNKSLARYYDGLLDKRLEEVAAAERKKLASENDERTFAELRRKTAAEYLEKLAAQELARQKAKQERITAEYRHAAEPTAPVPARIYPAAARAPEATAKYAESIYGPEPDDELIPDEIYAEFDIRAEEDSDRSAEPETDWHKKLRALRDEWFQAPETKVQIAETKVQITETKLQIPEAAAQAEPEEPPAPPPQAPGRAKLPKLLRLLYDSVRDIAAAVRSK